MPKPFPKVDDWTPDHSSRLSHAMVRRGHKQPACVRELEELGAGPGFTQQVLSELINEQKLRVCDLVAIARYIEEPDLVKLAFAREPASGPGPR